MTIKDSELSGSGGGGIYPSGLIVLDPTYVPPTGGAGNSRLGKAMSGFDEDGDSIQLPSNSTLPMQYFDAAGSEVATNDWGSGGISIANVSAAITGTASDWVGFTKAASGDVFAMISDTGASPDEYGLISITKAGNITEIAAPTAPGTPFTTAPLWITPSSQGASNLYLDPASGEYHLRVYANTTIGTEQLRMNSSGVIQDDVTPIGDIFMYYKALSGVYCSGLDGGGSHGVEIYVNDGTRSGRLSMPFAEGLADADSGRPLFPMQWNGRIEFSTPHASATRAGIPAMTVLAFDALIDALGLLIGIS